METKAKIDFFYDRNEDWESTYNNQNFFEYNLHRMRYLVVDTELKNNPFEGCVDLETLEVNNSMQWERLKQLRRATTFYTPHDFTRCHRWRC